MAAPGPQLYFEDVEVGQEIPSLVKQPTTRQLVMYAGASRDFAEHHYDKDMAQKRGFPRQIVHGCLKAAFLAQMLTDWGGPHAFIRKFAIQYRAVDLPGDSMMCRGRVTAKTLQHGRGVVKCDVWTENPAGQVTSPASAELELPSRGSGG